MQNDGYVTTKATNLCNPVSIDISHDNNFAIFTETSCNRVRKMIISNSAISYMAGRTDGHAGFNDGYGNEVKFNYPTGVVISKDDAA